MELQTAFFELYKSIHLTRVTVWHPSKPFIFIDFNAYSSKLVALLIHKSSHTIEAHVKASQPP